jgi:hypothetical protein
MSIANTTTNTKIKDLRLKLNEVIVAVNVLQSNGIAANTSQLVNGNTKVILLANGNVRFNNGSLISLDEQGAGTGSIDIAPGGANGWTEIRSVDYENYVWVDNGGIYVATGWNTDAKLWTYTKDGKFNFPDGTYQTTAFSQQLLNPYLQVSNANAKFATKAYAASNTAVRLLINDRIQVANVAAKYATKAYAASNAYVKLLLANTNAYIADVAAASGGGGGGFSAEALDYGLITSSVDVDLNRDYGTL